MNAEIGELMRQLDPQIVDSADGWTRVSIVRNIGQVSTDATVSATAYIQGFKLLVAHATGAPAWIGRCSRKGDAAVDFQARLLDQLSRDPVSGRHVPPCRAIVSAHLHFVMTAFHGSKVFAHTAERLSPRDWEECLREIADRAGLVMARAAELVPELRGATDPTRRHKRLEASLARLEAVALGPDLVRPLREALRGWETVPATPQHGDLWAGNVLRYADSWWFIDFEECGRVASPLYDILHLVSAAPRRARARPWYAMTAGGTLDAWGRARHAIVGEHAERASLSRAQVGAALVYYLADLLAFRLRPGTEGLFTTQVGADLRRVSQYLSAGGSLDRLVPFDR